MINPNTQKNHKKKPSQPRLLWGTVVFIMGFLSPLLIPWVLSLQLSTGVKSVMSGFLAFGIPELFILIAVGILGKDGFQYLKRIISLLFRRYGPPDVVSKSRYIFGLILFSYTLILGFVLPYIWTYIPFIEDHLLYILISSDIILLISLFILGGDFWDKLRSLFIYRSRSILVDNPQNDKQ
jgi:hypothetical protein